MRGGVKISPGKKQQKGEKNLWSFRLQEGGKTIVELGGRRATPERVHFGGCSENLPGLLFKKEGPSSNPKNRRQIRKKQKIHSRDSDHKITGKVRKKDPCQEGGEMMGDVFNWKAETLPYRKNSEGKARGGDERSHRERNRG